MMKYILSPVISCILNIDSYINAALNIGTSESIDTTIKISGIYSPGNFFILFIVVLLAIFIFILFNMKYSIDEDKDLSEAYINRGSRKFDVFIGGENEEEGYGDAVVRDGTAAASSLGDGNAAEGEEIWQLV